MSQVWDTVNVKSVQYTAYEQTHYALLTARLSNNLPRVDLVFRRNISSCKQSMMKRRSLVNTLNPIFNVNDKSIMWVQLIKIIFWNTISIPFELSQTKQFPACKLSQPPQIMPNQTLLCTWSRRAVAVQFEEDHTIDKCILSRYTTPSKLNALHVVYLVLWILLNSVMTPLVQMSERCASSKPDKRNTLYGTRQRSWWKFACMFHMELCGKMEEREISYR